MLSLRLAIWLPAAVLLLASSVPARGSEPVPPAHRPTAEQTRFFEESVRPILAERCFSCHGESKQRGDLRVDSLNSLLAGGESGPALDLEHPGQSLLVEAIRYESYEMPPTGKLPDEEVAVLTRWVETGAAWPGYDGAVRELATGGSKITDEDRAWWSFQPIADPQPPTVDDGGWCRNEIDRFVFQSLADQGLAPAGEADRRALIRRVYFDLTGLPPTPDEVEAFVANPADDAYERLVDRLLDSSQYGERWARHWLDLVRYAESDGYRQDAFRPYAWRYRDYVIRAFNEDKPYDRFVLEQLAGDEAFPHDLDALNATAFLRHWIYEYNQRDVRTQWDNILVDITNVTGDVFLGMSVGCARCHDHKFDPILKEDYYRLKAFFTPLLPRDDLPYADGSQWNEYQRQQAEWEARTAEIRQQMAQLERPLVEAARRRAIDKFPLDIRPMIHKSPEEREPFEHQLAELSERQSRVEVRGLDFAKQLKGEALEKWLALKSQLDQFDSLKPKPLPPAFTVTDVGPVAPPTVMAGDRQQRDILPGFLTALNPARPEIVPPPSGNSTGRRTALARWITSPENPLAARVIVNRIWQQHFSSGLVGTTSDFGRLGDLPTHPELLDWLATRFVADGWRFKPLHRLIVLSAAYRQSALRETPQLALETDPQNRWLWRMNVRRLDAEQIRDAMLATSGELNLANGGPSVDGNQPRRSVYCKTVRNSRDPLLEVFDSADGFASTDRRHVTTTPTQSLLMLNGPWPLARARAMASRLQKLRLQSDAEFVDRAFALAYGRAPEEHQRQRALAFLAERIAEAQAAAKTQPEEGPSNGTISGREGLAAEIARNRPEDRLVLGNKPSLPDGDFTVEAVIVLRSLYEDATVCTIAAHWDDNNAHPGWALGVTSQKSSYQPRNLILQLVGDPAKGGAGYEVIASGLRPELNKPYYVAVSVRIDDTSPSGVTFYLKDLSDPDSTMQTAQVAHRVVGHYRSQAALMIGGRDGSARHQWDGLIDDVRVSDVAREESQLLIHDPAVDQHTVAFWRFEPVPGFHQDASPQENHLARATSSPSAQQDARATALADLCHILLNSNEFLYTD